MVLIRYKGLPHLKDTFIWINMVFNQINSSKGLQNIFPMCSLHCDWVICAFQKAFSGACSMWIWETNETEVKNNKNVHYLLFTLYFFLIFTNMHWWNNLWVHLQKLNGNDIKHRCCTSILFKIIDNFHLFLDWEIIKRH